MNVITNIVRKSYQNDGPANILLIGYDGYFDADLCLTGHNFFTNKQWSRFNWQDSKKHSFKFIHEDEIHDYSYDFILTSNAGTLQEIRMLSSSLHLPVLFVDHEQGIPNYLDEGVRDKVEKEYDVLIAGQFVESDYHLIEGISLKFDTKIIGKNPGLSKPVTSEMFYNMFDRARVYLNFSVTDGLSCYFMQALKSHCGLVTNTNQVIDRLNIPVASSHDEIVEQIDKQLESPMDTSDILKKVTVPKKQFVEKWKNLIESNRSKIYERN